MGQKTSEPPSPGAPVRQNSRYMDLLLDGDKVPRLCRLLASFFSWILLAGFVIFPGTFTTITNQGCTPNVEDDSTSTITLLAIAGTCTGIGAAGMLLLWWLWRKNYVWIVNKIFLCETFPILYPPLYLSY